MVTRNKSSFQGVLKINERFTLISRVIILRAKMTDLGSSKHPMHYINDVYHSRIMICESRNLPIFGKRRSVSASLWMNQREVGEILFCRDGTTMTVRLEWKHPPDTLDLKAYEAKLHAYARRDKSDFFKGQLRWRPQHRKKQNERQRGDSSSAELSVSSSLSSSLVLAQGTKENHHHAPETRSNLTPVDSSNDTNSVGCHVDSSVSIRNGKNHSDHKGTNQKYVIPYRRRCPSNASDSTAAAATTA
jgi:hypothetical protein